MKREAPVRVAIADDNRTMLTSLSEFLNYSPHTDVVLTASNGSEMLECLKSLPDVRFPEVVLTDVNMPEMDGIELVRRGKALYPSLKFLMLTVHDDEDTLFEAIKAGANGYLMKDEMISVIVKHVQHLANNGSVPMSVRIARKTLELLSRIDRSGSSDAGSNLDRFDLSDREKEVLQLLVNGLDYRSIARELSISPHTVRKHTSNIYDKLHVSSKTQAINLVNQRIARHHETSTNNLNIVLADDHQIILDSLSMMLSTVPGISVTGKFSDSREVMPYMETHAVDLLISDISMPHINGLELAGKMKTTYPEVKVMMLTVSEDLDQVQRAHELGVEGYLLKRTGKEELSRAIHQIMEGQSYYFNEVRV